MTSAELKNLLKKRGIRYLNTDDPSDGLKINTVKGNGPVSKRGDRFTMLDRYATHIEIDNRWQHIGIIKAMGKFNRLKYRRTNKNRNLI